MKTKFLTIILLVATMLSGFGCDKAATIQKLENLADELRVHNRSIARVTNEFHAAGRLTDAFHKGVLTANDKFSKALDGADAAIVAAKKITEGDEAKSALDYARRFIDVNVFPAFVGIVDAVIDIPPDVKQRIEEIIALIRIAFAAIQTLFADLGMPIKLEELNHA